MLVVEGEGDGNEVVGRLRRRVRIGIEDMEVYEGYVGGRRKLFRQS